MANEEVLGPRKTALVLVIVVGCFAVLWPRLIGPMFLGSRMSQGNIDAGCCEVLFDTEVAVLEVLSEVCSSALGVDGKLSPHAAAECRRAVNATCGVDIAGFLKRNENVGKTTKMLLDVMKASNSSCLKEHYGVHEWNLNAHTQINSWTQQTDKLKQERQMRGAGPHPALRERGRAIPAGAPTPPSRGPVPLPLPGRRRSYKVLGGGVHRDPETQEGPRTPNHQASRVGPPYKPPPIPGMRPPLGSAGYVTAPKSSTMGLLMPIYTICIILFFVYTLSKIFIKRTTYSYDTITPDPQFRRHVFRDNSRTTPDTTLGPRETDTRDEELELLRARLEETERAMQRIVMQLAKRADAEVQDDHTRPYTNGSVLNNSNAAVRIIASEYQDTYKPKEDIEKEPSPEPKEPTPEPKEPIPEPKERTPEPSPKLREVSPEPKQIIESKETTPELPELTTELELTNDLSKELREASDDVALNEILKLTGNGDVKRPDSLIDSSKDFLSEELNAEVKIVSTSELEQGQQGGEEKKQSTPELLAEALKEDSPQEEEVSEEEIEIEVEEEEEEEEEEVEPEKSTVKVLGMEMTAHSADGGAWPRAETPMTAKPTSRAPHTPDEVTNIYLETEIPQQSRVLITDFADRTGPAATKHSPLVVSGKMTLSLIQDTPRDTPDRDIESTVDDFTTASATTQHGEKAENESDEEVEEEEIEIEEIEEEVEVEEDEEEQQDAQKK